MKANSPIYNLLLILLCFGFYQSGRSADMDTMQRAHQLVERKNYKEAERLLAPFVKVHANETNLWFYGAVAHWANKDKASIKAFNKATTSVS
jgi:hypothetical protein